MASLGFPQSGLAAPRPMLAARDLVMQFGGMRAVNGMSMDLQKGEILGLIGPNGAGKTTFFNLLAGALTPTSGEIIIGDKVATKAPAHARLAMGLGRTFQIPKPFAEMSVLENVLVGAMHQSGETLIWNFLAPFRIRAEERAAIDKAQRLLQFLTLSHLADQPARVLSGGQRKLLELARVLMADPAILLLDEPAAGVNPVLLDFIIERVLELNANGTTILLIEHNMEMVARLCGRVIVMAEGKLLCEGKPEDVARDPEVVEAYLGGA